MRPFTRVAGCRMRLSTTFLRAVAMLAALALVAGCAESSRPVATGKGLIRGMNAMIDSPETQFLIEETSLANLSYKDSSPDRPWDDLTYTFNFDIRVPDELTNRRIARQFLDVIADTEYLIVAAGTVASPDVIVWENPEREWDDAETVFELSFGHAAPAFGAVDIYFAVPGTDPVAGNQVATLSYRDRSDIREFAAGDYEVVVTPANDPSTILHRSISATYAATGSSVVVVLPGDPSTTSTINLRLVPETGTAVELPDVTTQPTVRFLHGAFGTGNVDVVRDSDFANPLAPDLAFRNVSGDITVPAGTATYDWVPNGNTTPLISDADRATPSGTRLLHLFLGAPDNYGIVVLPSVRRSLGTSARMRFTNGAVSIGDPIDI